MKFLLAGSCLILLYITANATEDSDATITKATSSTEGDKLYYPKKVKSLKKNLLKSSLKKLADISEKFKDLPADDLSFIKELDKQFKLHGERIKIKVENNNATEGKSSKRTIDGELGYGYNGYQYDPPKFMFYPYSQKNIENNSPHYFFGGNGKTEVTVEPSYSYELKSQSYITHSQPQIDIPKSEYQQHYHNEQQGYNTQKQPEYEEPVIVLRIPGPAKYATHLQMLLQKYLEIRASQYLHILEEVEQRNHQQQQHQLQQLDYGSEPDDYTKQTDHEHQNVDNRESVQHLEIDKVYQNYKNRYSSQRHQTAQQPLMHIQPFYASQQSEAEQQVPQYDHLPQHQYPQQQAHHQYKQAPFQYHQNIQEQHSQLYYPTPQHQYTQPENPPAHTYQQVYLVPMVAQEQVDYKASAAQPESEPVYQDQDQENQDEHSLSLPVAENNPRPSHTKVVFTNKNQHSAYDYQMYQLPSIKPNERHAPSSQPDYHQDFQQPQYDDLQVKQVPTGSSTNNQHTADPEVMIIAQRPYNYHAHSVKVRFRGRSPHPKRTPTKQEADAGSQKTNKLVRNKLGAETDSAVDLKTAQDTDSGN